MPDLLKCQMPLSDVHDEHLFIVVHQGNWFLFHIFLLYDLFFYVNTVHSLPWHRDGTSRGDF